MAAGHISWLVRGRLRTFVVVTGRVVGKGTSTAIAVCALTALAAGCSGRASPASAQSPVPSSPIVRTFQTPVPSASSPAGAGGAPLPAGTTRQLPSGTFYLLAGRDLRSLSIWEVAADGREQLLARGRPGYGIDAFAASRAGIVLAEAAGGVDHLARLTSHGPAWLHSVRDHGGMLHGSSPDIRGNGTIGYVTPPGHHRGERAGFAIWIRRSFGGADGMLLHQRRALDGPVFGPGGRVAVEDWVGAPGKRRPGIIIYGHGPVRRLSLGVPAIPSLVAWGERAPALAIAFPAHQAELLYPGGRRQPLPSGWQPLAWNPAGTRLLMQSAAALGIWSAAVPGQVTRLGPTSAGAQILQVVWLAREAPL